ncbi:uncharacterized protein LOC110389202 [Numida meleagris]|uniref:uncharacterized protein LOC110389202 n=1 Tax=Numida meleagris TaxID=8996 RepID=UPI000B3E0714|nr:uncharacterized protein LOC110389202 [Numida meleagris]
MLSCGRRDGGRRAPHHCVMEMGEVFLQLCQEVARLRELCSRQSELLQKLSARKGPVLDIPTSLPIQCTEDAWAEGGEQPAASPQVHPEASHGSAHPLAPLHAAHVLPGSGGWFPVCSDLEAGRAALPGAFGSSQAGRKEKMLVDTWLEDCRMAPTTNSPEEEVRPCCSPQEFAAPSSEAADSFLTILDLYEAPEALRGEDAPSESALPAADKVPVEIRGPLKTSWTPGWVLEDSVLGPGAAAAAQTCDICQEIFPADTAAQADYLKHVLTHMK